MLELIRACGVEPRPFLTIAEASKILGLSTSKTYAAARAGLIPARQFGRRYVVPLVPFLEIAMKGEVQAIYSGSGIRPHA